MYYRCARHNDSFLRDFDEECSAKINIIPNHLSVCVKVRMLTEEEMLGWRLGMLEATYIVENYDLGTNNVIDKAVHKIVCELDFHRETTMNKWERTREETVRKRDSGLIP